MLEFRILGPLEVLDAETSVPLVGRNQRALLTLLLLRANEPVSSERLVNELWGEHPPRTATTSLQNAISQLRKLLGPGLLHTPRRPEVDAGGPRRQCPLGGGLGRRIPCRHGEPGRRRADLGCDDR